MKRKALPVILLLLLGAIAYHSWFVHVNYRFDAVSNGRVYKSAAIPPERLDHFIQENGIKTVIDLRHAGLHDRLNPANQAEIDAEAAAIARLPGVAHINIPSPQVPTRETLSRFFEVLDDEESYPVLIHCHHGTGRTEIYSALYRIEYEQWENRVAREQTRPVVEFAGYRSAFADGSAKGDFLMHYKPRRLGEASTLSTLK